MANELIDMLNSSGLATGKTKLKSEAHEKGFWHASAQIWIFTPNGDILIQKRSSNKDTYPNLWDISVAGHLSAGDSPISAALREIKEEVGLVISAESLIFLKTIKNSKRPNKYIQDNEFNHLFICSTSIQLNKLIPQTEEVTDVKLISIHEFINLLKNNYNDFVPHGMDYYLYIINCIFSALYAEKN